MVVRMNVARAKSQVDKENAADRVRVFLVDDHSMLREGIRHLLEGDGEFEVIGEADSVEEALECLERKMAEIVVMDINLPGVDGVEGTRQMKARYPELKVVILSAYGEKYLVPSIDAGADGYLLKTLPPAELLRSMHQAALGQSPVDVSLTRYLMNQAATGLPGDGLPTEQQQIRQTNLKRAVLEANDDAQEKAETQPVKTPAYPLGLTQREIEVIRLIAMGKTDREIGKELFISFRTAGNHLRSILNKTDAANRAEAAAYATRHGLTGEDDDSGDID